VRGGLLLSIIFFMFAPTALVAQSVRVLVLDALNGKPQSGVEVHYFCQSETHNFLPRRLRHYKPRRDCYRLLSMQRRSEDRV
jgi:hypothetical protein